MTVRVLIDWLGDFDEDAEVVIGEQQRYGSDFAYDISTVSEQVCNEFYGDSDSETKVCINLGSQIGTVDYEDEDY